MHVQDTASDAASCKLSAVQLGYWEDSFAHMFAKPNRKMPIINRGYYARVRSIEVLLHRFLASTSPTSSSGDSPAQQLPYTRQIIVLGAGQDSMYFRLKSRPRDSVSLDRTLYIELDFPAITRSKVRLCRRHKALSDVFGAVETNNDMELKAHGYALLACDLRNLSTVQAKLHAAGIQPSVPTLILSECVMCYMDPADSAPLIGWFGAAFADATFIVYEQIRPNDAFGQTMVTNIHMRGCDLKSISTYPDVEDQRRRFHAAGFSHVECWDMNQIYYDFLDPVERKQKERLEMFDEVEEYHLLQAHYCVVVASTTPTPALRLVKTATQHDNNYERTTAPPHVTYG
ncbi:hypothetical protein DYB25_011389 [Aphanomyces astaci]|uniref:Leucine carboxyl methyltransferase 1 n=2 Tax=Aphanomyces astaci TaxID=112090 RepID=A0A397D3T5_APHAT|nr:hypothetical protein DYB25_011389 [Aphanomyces astaci]RHY43118.1 hypothetical protein DYB34_011861 [Aphanomyces astaci]RHY58260.1 hypothetical protein DYB30_012005 [Aphanomyces astaci]RHY85305.1 hypothetical protein DYB26_008047 [Aphanomyces astaci]RHZ13626.1 hypothetical protein DYB31_009652 [Aphanomyces astaci]